VLRLHHPSAVCDVAILDTKLPDGYGADLIAGLRERCPGCRAVVMSAAMGPESLTRASGAGADAVVDKVGWGGGDRRSNKAHRKRAASPKRRAASPS
jgi:DNA-binding NarL/FixJ family response regulator